MNAEGLATQARVNSQIAAHIPHGAWESTVVIVIANPPRLHLLGTGTLFQIADSCFVVTAAHVLADAHLAGKTIGISTGSGFVATGGDWIVSTSGDFQDEQFDIAVFRLPESSIARLRGKRFLRLSDVSFQIPERAVFTLFGFPGMWSLPILGESDKLIFKPLEFTATTFDDKGKNLRGYNPRYHLLMDAPSDYLTLEDGTPTRLMDRAGEDVSSIAQALGGISGCGVWMIGDLGKPISQWGNSKPIVAVETSMYSDSLAIRATKWCAVTTLIYEAFPDLRPAINLWL